VVAIAALVVWLLTAAAGLTLLTRGSLARRKSAPAPAPAPASVPVPGAGRGADGAMPDIPRVKVHAPPNEHPLLEFSHPTLGLLGLGLWFVYVGTHRQPLAWVAFGVLVLTIVAGLSWLLRSARDARAAGRPGRVLPTGLALLHGLLATATFLLAVLTALVASHG
jgi:hypothetical protein